VGQQYLNTLKHQGHNLYKEHCSIRQPRKNTNNHNSNTRKKE